MLAPEHPLVQHITTEEQRAAVEAYKRETAAKSDLDRTELAKEKTGVFTGGFAINPVNGKQIPIWVADYVLMSYGTGAIMAVPAHDERDFEFAHAYKLPIVPVYDPDISDEERQKLQKGELCWPGNGTCVNSENSEVSLNGLQMPEAIKKITKYLEDQGKGKFSVSYKLRDWLFSRQRYWGEPFPILHLADGAKRLLDIDELPLLLQKFRTISPQVMARAH